MKNGYSLRILKLLKVDSVCFSEKETQLWPIDKQY